MATFNLTNNSTIFLFFFTHEDLQKGAQDKKWVYDQAEKNQSITIFFLASEQSVIVSVP